MNSRNMVLPFVLLAVAVQPLAAQQRGRAATPATPQPVANAATVAFLDFTGSAMGRNAADFASLAAGIPHHLGYALAKNASIRLVDRAKIAELIKEQDMSSAGRVDSSTLVRAGKVLGAHHMLSGSFIAQADGQIAISITSTAASSGNAPANPPAAHPPAANPPAGSAPARNTIPASAPANVDQNRLILLEGAALKAEDRGDVRGAVALWKQVLALNPNYDGAKVRVAVLEPR
jgi:hypothetical protein